MDSNQSLDNQKHPFEFDFQLRDLCRSLSYYAKNDDGELQLKFDPPVFQARYAAINSILSMQELIPHIKKVVFRHISQS